MRATDLFDNYLNGKLGEEELVDFNQRVAADTAFAQAFEEHQHLVKTLTQKANRDKLKKELKAIHHREFGSGRIVSLNQDTFAKRFGKTAAIAATTALVAVLSTVAVLSMGGYLLKQQNNELIHLNREILNLKYSSEAVNEKFAEEIKKNSQKPVYAPANLEGSAFAMNNNGYVITSFHTIEGADSIFIQNNLTERTLTRLVFSDPKLDLAILKIENTNVVKNWQVPFSIKEKSTDIGEKVFTLGYPRKDVVYGEGSLSSLSGFSNDTVMYQVSIPVNPGNSGGPLLDDQGNVIGVISGKQNSSEATGFAIKANEILKSIRSQATDTTTRKELLAQTKKPALKNLKRSEQIKKINPYVFNVLVYKRAD